MSLEAPGGWPRQAFAFPGRCAALQTNVRVATFVTPRRIRDALNAVTSRSSSFTQVDAAIR